MNRGIPGRDVTVRESEQYTGGRENVLPASRRRKRRRGKGAFWITKTT